MVGLYIGGKQIPVDGRVAFEVEILDKGTASDVCNISVGICTRRYPLDINPGTCVRGDGGRRRFIAQANDVLRSFLPSIYLKDCFGLSLGSLFSTHNSDKNKNEMTYQS
jgi:hypothetical protein